MSRSSSATPNAPHTPMASRIILFPISAFSILLFQPFNSGPSAHLYNQPQQVPAQPHHPSHASHDNNAPVHDDDALIRESAAHTLAKVFRVDRNALDLSKYSAYYEQRVEAWRAVNIKDWLSSSNAILTDQHRLMQKIRTHLQKKEQQETKLVELIAADEKLLQTRHDIIVSTCEQIRNKCQSLV
ncbi:hypothetical protein B0H13DRAFT_2379094 [Mycena leptocephala]|nr:hypothetical protein B0H13DRAFT_2379094 [Mycena leptocephala]